MRRLVWTVTFACCVLQTVGSAQNTHSDELNGSTLLDRYFEIQTTEIESTNFKAISTLNDWTDRRPEYRRQLLEMLGLYPMPPKTDLSPVVLGTHNKGSVTVERLQFQSLPGVYVTGNLYRPSHTTKPLPAILYVCGHARERSDEISLGNKTHYQHHGAWFARNGYVCLTIDTVQLGEIEGIHHGTYREGMWWWNSRGYTPAGAETLNCIRSLDYLQTRDDVDGERIGVTGRSGGGVYSWWIAAIDDRIKVAVPVAGITSLRNHVVDGCVEGHCDCMYMLNLHRWDFAKVAALVAPRPLLISNSDKDRIFPLDGVVDVYNQTKKIYSLYDATDQLGLHVTEGPHQDTQELRIAAFRWMNRFLRQDDALIEDAAKPLFDKKQLRVFEQLPADERVTSIHEFLVPLADPESSRQSAETRQKLKETLLRHSFCGWPDLDSDTRPRELDVDPSVDSSHEIPAESSNGFSASRILFESQPPYQLSLLCLQRAERKPQSTRVIVADSRRWQTLAPAFAVFFPDQFPQMAPDLEAAKQFTQSMTEDRILILAPRGVGPTAWTHDARARTHIRRRFMLLGQTEAGMQIFDTVRGLQALGHHDSELKRWIVEADGEAAFWAAHASLFVDGIDELQLSGLAPDYRSAPDLLNVSRVLRWSDVLERLEIREGKSDGKSTPR